MTLRFGNMIRETSTTTGTGTYDLAGASAGYIGFVAAGFAGQVVVYKAQMGNDWEIGLGTITDAATDTLARTEILETLVSGTYDNTSPSAVTWGAGTKTIDLVGPAEVIGPAGWYSARPGSKIDGGYYVLSNFTGTVALVANRQFFTPIYHAHYAKIECEMAITTGGGASTLFDFGIYDIGDDGEPNNLIQAFTGNDANAPGSFNFKTTNQQPPGIYFGSLLTNGTPTVRGNSSQNLELQGIFYKTGSVSGFTRTGYLTQTYASGLINPFVSYTSIDAKMLGVAGRAAT